MKEGATEAQMAAGLLEKNDGATEEITAANVKTFLEKLRRRSLLPED